MINEIINYGKGELIYNQKLKLTKEPDLRNLFWETTLRCNAKCKHCGSRAGENCKIKEIRKRPKRGVFYFDFSE